MAKKLLKKDLIAIRDTVTGNIEDLTQVSIYVSQKKQYKSESFTLYFQDANLYLSRVLQPISCKLLLYITAIVQYENIFSKDQDEICKDLKYSRTQLYRGIKELKEYDVITEEKLKNDKRKSVYRLNPYQSWKGVPKQRSILKSHFKENQYIINFLDEKQDGLLPNNDF